MDIKEATKIFLIGIGGIGMSALARLFLAMGKQVSGSDLKHSDILENMRMLGVNVFIGHDPKNINPNYDLVVYSADITEQSEGYKELEQAQKLGLNIQSYAKVLGALMQGKYGIGVTGTNGKSTTTALLGLILDAAEFDPTVVAGTQISPANENEKFKANARLGSGKHVVVEADEYQRKMLETKPRMIVLTNIAEDHLDYYKDLEDIKNAFRDYVKSLPKDGILIFNADDHNTVDIVHHANCHKFSFGIHHYADLQAMNIKVENGKQTFDMHYDDEKIGTFELHVPAKYNVSNALGASLAAIKLGVKTEIIEKVLREFAGTWRRFETIGKLGSAAIISDYGHHPAGVLGTIEAAKEFYPGKKILIVFQPHHRNRTKRLFGEFVEALTRADDLIIPEIFEVAGREHGEDISSRDLVNELKKLGTNAEYANDLAHAEGMVRNKLKDFDVVIFMGAGDVDLLARKLVHYNTAPY
ncbi:MAG: UDP-N-acetylmuramate--L-alanine ligase [Candidatus Doudnabacteria bacterium]|nr:UDP-N-acetylmuramate--L-alanine ligase [Candidatus Doudnabacteria bacterium]